MAALPQTQTPPQPDYLNIPPEYTEKLLPAAIALFLSWMLVR